MTQRRWDQELLQRIAVMGVVVALSAPVTLHAAKAAQLSRQDAAYGTSVRLHAQTVESGMAASHRRYNGRYAAARFARAGTRLQCVPFARENSGIEIVGNAVTWWNSAAGIYERGSRPEVGSVLNFRANGRMRLGHVAVVSKVIDSRNVEIDHANWGGAAAGRNGIAHDIQVVDVSEANDWSAVRVSLSRAGEFGSVYPTYGFIYDRPDRGVMVANTTAVRGAPPMLNAPPSDLRPVAERALAGLTPTQDEEVAEAEDEPTPRRQQVSARRAGPVTAASPRGRLAPVNSSRHPVVYAPARRN